MNVQRTGRLVLAGGVPWADGFRRRLGAALGEPESAFPLVPRPGPDLLDPGDLLVDLDGTDAGLVAWCRQRDVRLVTPAWPSAASERGPTVLFGQGAWGLLACFTKIALRDAAIDLRKRLPEGPRRAEIDRAREAEDFARL